LDTLKEWRKKRFEILIYFSLWKSLLPLEEKQSFDCAVCQKRELFKNRYCFRYNETELMPIPSSIEIDERYNMPVVSDVTIKRITADEFLDGIFVQICELFPEKPPFQVLQDYKMVVNSAKDICITGLIEDDYLYVMDLYDTCKTYNCLPTAGGVEDQNPKIMQIFKVLDIETVRFEKIRLENTKKEK